MRSAGDGRATSRRRGLRAQLEGLSWWQVFLALLPLCLAPIGGAIGGGIGGAAAAANLGVARRQAPAPVKAAAMICICALAFGSFFGVSVGIRRALTSRQTPKAPPARPLPARTGNVQPPGDAGWQSAQAAPSPGVAVNPPAVVHATGAELSWPAYVNTSGNPANDLAGYEVHRSTDDLYTPSAATLLASVGAHTTTYADSTVPPVGGTYGSYSYYMVAVRTRSGALIAGPIRLVWIPPAGQTEIVVPAVAATTLSSAHPATAVHAFTEGGSSRPWLGVGKDNDGYGVTRAVFGFGPLNAVPAHSAIVGARLSLWNETSVETWSDGRYTVHALTRSFSGAQATWDSAAAGTPWTRPGGDFRPAGGLGLPAPGEEPQRSYFDATAIVRRWLRSPGSGHGLLLKAQAKPVPWQERAFFMGLSAADPAQRPALVILVSGS